MVALISAERLDDRAQQKVVCPAELELLAVLKREVGCVLLVVSDHRHAHLVVALAKAAPW